MASKDRKPPQRPSGPSSKGSLEQDIKTILEKYAESKYAEPNYILTLDQATQSILQAIQARVPTTTYMKQPDLGEIHESYHWVYYRGQKSIIDDITAVIEEKK